MFGDIMGKLKEPQEKVKITKERQDHVVVIEQSSDGLLKIEITANRTIKKITVDDALLADKEQLEDYLILVTNNAIAKATKMNETELVAVAKDGMPNIPGMDALFNQ